MSEKQAVQWIAGLRKVNVMYWICDHLFGDGHTHKHRMIVGFLVMVCGVLIAKSATGVHYEFIQISLDGIGYFIHGMGAVPYAEAFVALAARSE